MRLRGLAVVLALAGIVSACEGKSSLDARGTPTVGAPAGANIATVGSRPTPRHGGALPTAVRVLSTDPRDVALRPADLPQGYYLSTEHAAVDVELWRPSAISAVPDPQPRRPPGTGRHVVLSRNDGPDPDGATSVSTSAVRYETTNQAAISFAAEVEATPDRSSVESIDTDDLDDEAQSWRYRISAVMTIVVVDEILVRRRNFLLSVTVVHTPVTGAHGIALRYARLMRTKLPD